MVLQILRRRLRVLSSSEGRMFAQAEAHDRPEAVQRHRTTGASIFTLASM